MGKAIMCPAGPTIDGFRPHLTLTYVNLVALYPAVAATVVGYTLSKVKKRGDYRSLPARPLKRWGDNSYYIEGELEDFKRSLHDHLVGLFGTEIIASYRRAHIDVRGNWDQPIYERLRLLSRYP